MATKFSKFVYCKSCMDRLQFQNIYPMNRRPYFSLLDLKEKCTRYVGVSTKETDLFDRILYSKFSSPKMNHIIDKSSFKVGQDTPGQDARFTHVVRKFAHAQIAILASSYSDDIIAIDAQKYKVSPRIFSNLVW